MSNSDHSAVNCLEMKSLSITRLKLRYTSRLCSCCLLEMKSLSITRLKRVGAERECERGGCELEMKSLSITKLKQGFGEDAVSKVNRTLK